MLFVIVMFFMLRYTFEGEFFKVYLSACLTEFISVFSYSFSLGIVNYLNGNKNTMLLYDKFHVWDLLFPILLFLITRLTGIVIFPYIIRFRTWEIKHRKLMWAVFLFYGICAFSSYLVEKDTVLWGCILVLILYIIFIIGFILILRNNQQKIITEKRFHLTRQRLIESYLPDILTQQEQMDCCQKVINAQMEELIHLESTQIDDTKIRSYLSEIQQAYEHIRAGIYCNDWLMDSALCYEQKIMQKESILFSCNLQGYHSGLISQEDILQILLFLLDWGIEENRRLPKENNKFIRLKLFSIKNHLFIQLETAGKRKRRIQQGSIRYCLKKYSGKILQEQMEDCCKTIINLQHNKINNLSD